MTRRGHQQPCAAPPGPGGGSPLAPAAAAADGFTLLEVLVALAILSFAVVAGIELFASGLRLLKRAGDHQVAALIADEKAREVRVPVEGRETGVEDGFTWERTISRTEVPAALVTPTSKPYALYAITVQVTWDRQHRVEVATLRTAHAAGPGDTTTQPNTPLAPSPLSPTPLPPMPQNR